MEVPVVPRPERSAFWNLVERTLPLDGDALDLGTGTGRVALDVAPRVRHVVGIDVDRSSLEAARWDAGRRAITNVKFQEGDAETIDVLGLNEGRPFSLVTARLFLSRPLLERIPSWIAPEGHLVVEALEQTNWQEAGGSRFNLPAQEVVDRLEAAALLVRDARVESHVHRFPNPTAAQTYLKERRLWTKWKQDGRWDRLRSTTRTGGTLTEAHLVVWAQRAKG